ncbi:MAG: 30S ribosomal protein S12 methylthiotransferase RimO [Candidatus Omnitrophica bacterium]|nr:30S ribosomal protein S12 methylthiotransferase RimO [Candidatus Omnitrophota bacterium]
MKKLKVYLLSLGCARNLIDSEIILGILNDKGFRIVNQPKDVDLAIVNSCAFIKEAKEESIETILEFIELKKEGVIQRLWVIGCLYQRYDEELKKELPEVDGFLGVEAWKHNLEEMIENLVNPSSQRVKFKIPRMKSKRGFRSLRFRLTPSHYAYIKLSEGCDNFCSYCIIPKIRGSLRSRPLEEIIKEVKSLARGHLLKEINLVAQDTTLYGKDLYGTPTLLALLKELVKIKSISWIRILYMHPAHITDELIEFIAENEKICRYIDMPIQHISNRILARMGRKISKAQIYQLIDRLRRKIKNVALRTSIIVGFPGEKEADFQELVKFVQEVKFEHLGVFVYSKEEDTHAYNFPEQVHEKIKRERYNYLLEIQKEISLEILKGYIGKSIKVLIDEKLPEDSFTFLGRTEYDAPEVDGGVIIRDKSLKPGEFIKAKVIDTWEYDLLAQKI